MAAMDPLFCKPISIPDFKKSLNIREQPSFNDIVKVHS